MKRRKTYRRRKKVRRRKKTRKKGGGKWRRLRSSLRGIFPPRKRKTDKVAINAEWVTTPESRFCGVDEEDEECRRLREEAKQRNRALIRQLFLPIIKKDPRIDMDSAIMIIEAGDDSRFQDLSLEEFAARRGRLAEGYRDVYRPSWKEARRSVLASKGQRSLRGGSTRKQPKRLSHHNTRKLYPNKDVMDIILDRAFSFRSAYGVRRKKKKSRKIQRGGSKGSSLGGATIQESMSSLVPSQEGLGGSLEQDAENAAEDAAGGGGESAKTPQHWMDQDVTPGEFDEDEGKSGGDDSKAGGPKEGFGFGSLEKDAEDDAENEASNIENEAEGDAENEASNIEGDVEGDVEGGGGGGGSGGPTVWDYGKGSDGKFELKANGSTKGSGGWGIYTPEKDDSLLPANRAVPSDEGGKASHYREKDLLSSDVESRCSAKGKAAGGDCKGAARVVGRQADNPPQMKMSFREPEQKEEEGDDEGGDEGGDEGEGDKEGFREGNALGDFMNSHMGGDDNDDDGGDDDGGDSGEVLPAIDPLGYPPLPYQDSNAEIEPALMKNPHPPPFVEYDAAHRWTPEFGFRPLTRKDFPRWIDEDPDENWIARFYPKLRAQKDYEWRLKKSMPRDKPRKTMSLTSVAYEKQLGEKEMEAAPEKISDIKYWWEDPTLVDGARKNKGIETWWKARAPAPPPQKWGDKYGRSTFY